MQRPSVQTQRARRVRPVPARLLESGDDEAALVRVQRFLQRDPDRGDPPALRLRDGICRVPDIGVERRRNRSSFSRLRRTVNTPARHSSAIFVPPFMRWSIPLRCSSALCTECSGNGSATSNTLLAGESQRWSRPSRNSREDVTIMPEYTSAMERACTESTPNTVRSTAVDNPRIRTRQPQSLPGTAAGVPISTVAFLRLPSLRREW